MSTVRKHSSDRSEYIDYSGGQWPATISNVKQALDLIGPWARTDVGIPNATYTVRGLAAIATIAEIDEGTNNDKIVTPAGLAHRMSKPEATEDAFGTTRYATNSESMSDTNNTRAATPKSIHYVFTNRTATEARIGTAKVATSTLATTGSDDTTIMTPLKTKLAINALVPIQATASETVKGVSKLATYQEALAGVAREGIALSPYAFSKANASESQAGTVKVANQAQMTQDLDNVVVSPRKFKNTRASLSQVGTTQLTNSLGNESQALSGKAPVVNRNGDNIPGRLKMNGDDYIVRSELEANVIPIGFICMAAMLMNEYFGAWVPCDGRSLSKTKYPVLFSRIGYTYGGSGDNFNVPNMNDRFVRGAHNGRKPGVKEEDAMQRITANWIMDDQAVEFRRPTGALQAFNNQRVRYDAKSDGSRDAYWVSFDSERQTRIASETRPKNIAMVYVIRIA